MNKIFDVNNLGALDLEGHILHPDSDFEKMKYAFVALGQGGGKVAIDFNRVGNYVTLFNSALEDLNDAESKLRLIGNNNYKITKFSGFDGAKKDRHIGVKAVHDNLDIIKNELLSDEKLYEADFVWVVVALGGGTGSGAVTDVTKIISSIIRREDLRLGYEEDDEYIINEGKPTVGVIAILPDNSSGHHIKLNAAEALQELKIVQDEGLLGSILLIDNDKLINNFLRDGNTNPNMKWNVRGNATVTELLTEVSITSSLPAEESFDKSELLDILSEPGYLAFSKYTFDKRHKDDMENIVNNSYISQVFADGYDMEEAIISSLLVIKKKNSPLFSSRDELLLKSQVSQLMPNTKYVHYGIYDVMTTKKYIDVIKSIGHVNEKSNDSKALIYTMTILKNPPRKIIEMTKDALDKKKESELKLSNSTNELRDLNIKENLVLSKKLKSQKSLELDSILGVRNSNKKKKIQLEDLINRKKV